MLDLLSYCTVRGLIVVLNSFPLQFRIIAISGFLRGVTLFIPSYRKVSFRNLDLVFPNESREFKENIYRKSFDSIARLIVDFARLHTLDEKWLREHVEAPLEQRYAEVKRERRGKGIVLATGHLGSFELLAHYMAVAGFPVSFIVRNFKLPRLDRWWTHVREAHGNKVIPRKGAVKEVIRNLGDGIDAALLFDQNITRNHAVFVNWFGRPGATAMTLGFAAVKAEAPVFVGYIRYLGNDRYRIDGLELKFDSIYQDASLSMNDKIRVVTEQTTREFEKMILSYPEGWFWMHRRWKTAPEGEPENFYR